MLFRSVIGDAGHSSYCELVPGHFLVAELVEELAALAQGSHSSAEPYRIVVPYRSHPDTQVGTAALHSSKPEIVSPADSSTEQALDVALTALVGFACAVLAPEPLELVAAMVVVAMTAELLAMMGSRLMSARLVAVMMSKLRLHRYWLMGGMPSCAIRSFPCRRDH